MMDAPPPSQWPPPPSQWPPSGPQWPPSGPQPNQPPENERNRPIPTRAAWWAVAGFLLAQLLGSILLQIGAALTGDAKGAITELLGEMGLWTGFFTSCLIVSRRYGTGSLKQDFGFRIRPQDIGWGALAAIGGLAASGLVEFAFSHSRFAGSNTQLLTGQRGNTAGFAIVTAVVAIGAPIFEELFFRGLLLTTLRTRLGSHGAVWAQAIVFGFAHYVPASGSKNLSVVMGIAALGVILGYTAKLTGRLGAGIIAHSTFNLIATISILAS